MAAMWAHAPSAAAGEFLFPPAPARPFNTSRSGPLPTAVSMLPLPRARADRKSAPSAAPPLGGAPRCLLPSRSRRQDR